MPADCLLLRGRAVVNESTLTGESVPQMKDALPHTASAAALDMKGEHRVHVLYLPYISPISPTSPQIRCALHLPYISPISQERTDDQPDEEEAEAGRLPPEGAQLG